MSNEPATNARPANASQYIRTYAKDFAALSGKPAATTPPPRNTSENDAPSSIPHATKEKKFYTPRQPLFRRPDESLVTNDASSSRPVNLADLEAKAEKIEASGVLNEVQIPVEQSTAEPISLPKIIPGDLQSQFPTLQSIGPTPAAADQRDSILERLRARAENLQQRPQQQSSTPPTLPGSSEHVPQLQPITPTPNVPNSAISNQTPLEEVISHIEPFVLTSPSSRDTNAEPAQWPTFRVRTAPRREALTPKAPVPASVVEIPITATTPVSIPASLPIEAPAPVVISAPPPIQELSTTPVQAPAPFHSYTSDFSDRIDTQSASTFSVLAAEKDSRGNTTVIARKKSNLLPIILAVVLILVGVGGAAAAYKYMISKAPVALIQTVPTLITPDAEVALSGTADSLQQSLIQEEQTNIPENNVVVAYINQSTTNSNGITTQSPQPGGVLFQDLNLPAPDILLRNIDPESTVGIIHAGSETRPFFILRVTSYTRTFAGMLAWENSMPQDLLAFYPLYSAAVTEPTENGTSTAIQLAPAQSTGEFIDEIVDNHNARALKDTNGQTLMIYGYADEQTLIIARDEAAFTDLIGRLNASSH